MNRKYFWLKLRNDFFTDKRIKKLRKIAGGDTYTIIYLKMQLLSLKDEGYLYFDNVEATFEEEIALQIDEDVEDVKVTIAFLMNNDLLEQKEPDEYELTETKKCIGSETASTIRSRKCRAKQKALQCNNDATKCNVEIEKDIEKSKNKIRVDVDIFTYVEDNFARPLTPIELDTIKTWEDNDLTRYAVRLSVLRGKFTISYISKILYNWSKANIRTVQEAQQEQEEFASKKSVRYKSKSELEEEAKARFLSNDKD